MMEIGEDANAIRSQSERDGDGVCRQRQFDVGDDSGWLVVMAEAI